MLETMEDHALEMARRPGKNGARWRRRAGYLGQYFIVRAWRHDQSGPIAVVRGDIRRGAAGEMFLVFAAGEVQTALDDNDCALGSTEIWSRR